MYFIMYLIGDRQAQVRAGLPAGPDPRASPPPVLREVPRDDKVGGGGDGGDGHGDGLRGGTHVPRDQVRAQKGTRPSGCGQHLTK